MPGWDYLPSWVPLRFTRGDIGRDGQHVVHRKPLHDAVHQRLRGSRAAAVLEKVKLAHHVAGVPAGERGRGTDALQCRTVADDAGGGFPTAGRDKGLTFRNAARRRIGDKTGSWISRNRSHFVLGQFNDAASDWLGAAVWQRQPHVAWIDISLWHRVGFNDTNPGPRGERREICR